MYKHNVAIIFGGCSPEYDISLKSAFGVISHINKDKYEPIMLGITRKGEWYLFTGAVEKINDDTWHNQHDCIKAIISPDCETKGIIVFGIDGIQTIKLDAAMPIMHGKNGEDGTIQGLLTLAGIPVIGCNILSSALCMDKDRAHKLAKAAGVRVAKSFIIKSELEYMQAVPLAESLGYPLFVKPVKAGSSFGITKVACKDDLLKAIILAFEYDNEVIIEENICGFEVGCAVIGSTNPTVGEIDEIELTEGFFDYKEKYNLESSSIHVPARIPIHKADEIKETAKVLYKALGCSGFARVDMFLTPEGDIVFNEINTIPGFTAFSRFPNMLKATGMTFEQIVNEIIAINL